MNNNRCVFCGEIIPEGLQVCPACSNLFGEKSRQLVFICSPYSDKDIVKQAVNIANAKEYCRIAYGRGYLPIAPHLFFPQFLNDNDPTERKIGIGLGKQLLLKCSKLWICGERITDGMNEEILFALNRNIPCERIRNQGVYALSKGGGFGCGDL